jgi:uncharacterized protein
LKIVPETGIIIPNMGTNNDMARLGVYLFNKTRRGLLTLLLNRPGEAFYVNQIVNLLGTGSGAVQRELGLMTGAGIALREKQGNLVFYRANPDSPVFKELSRIIQLTSPVLPAIRDRGKGEVPSHTSKTDILLEVSRTRLASFCRQHHIRRLSFYGAVLKPGFRPEDTIDVLVEFEPDRVPGLFTLAGLETDLSEMYGRPVDLRTPGDLDRFIRDRILQEAEAQYAAR